MAFCVMMCRYSLTHSVNLIVFSSAISVYACRGHHVIKPTPHEGALSDGDVCRLSVCLSVANRTHCEAYMNTIKPINVKIWDIVSTDGPR